MPLKILVTGAGGASGVSLLRALRAPGVQLYAADIDPFAAGLYMVPAEQRLLLPRGDSPSFAPILLSQCQRAGIDVLIPTVDVELLEVARIAPLLEKMGVAAMVSPAPALSVCLDKWRLIQACRDRIPVPATVLLGPHTPLGALPCIVKPRQGSGSRGVRLIQSRKDFGMLPRDQTLILQEYLPGEEYSVDVFVTPDGTVRAAVPRARLKVDSGVAVTARTLHDPELEHLSVEVARLTGVHFVANIQWKRDRRGRPRLLEVNPRFPGTMPLTVAAGVDMPSLALRAIRGETIQEIARHREVAIVRRWEEQLVNISELESLCASAEVA